MPLSSTENRKQKVNGGQAVGCRGPARSRVARLLWDRGFSLHQLCLSRRNGITEFTRDRERIDSIADSATKETRGVPFAPPQSTCSGSCTWLHSTEAGEREFDDGSVWRGTDEGIGQATGAVVDTELQAGIRVHVGVRGEPTWSKHDGLDHGQCNAPRAGSQGSQGSVPGSNAGTPCLPCASNATNAPHVESSTPLPLLISCGMPPPSQAMPWLGQRDGLAPRYRTRAGG